MKCLHKCFVLAVLLVSAARAAESTDPSKQNPWSNSVQPNRELQDLLHSLASLLDRHLPQSHRDDAMAIVRVREECCASNYIGLEAVAGGRRDLVLQLLYFDGSATTHYESTAVLGWLRARKIGLPDILAATSQFLDAEDAQVRGKVEEFLLNAQYPSSHSRSSSEICPAPDFSILADTFRREREAVPRGLEPLAKHMFDKDPEQALRRLADVYLDGPHRDELTRLLDARKEETGSELELLRKLVASDHWWSEKWFVQLYAAEKACSNADLADEQVLKRLEATEHVIVWQRLNREEGKQSGKD